MKKLLSVSLCALFLIAFTSIGFASPLMDYSQGKGALDISIKPNTDITLESGDGSTDVDGKHGNLDAGLTYGLGKGWAVQYRYGTADTKSYSGKSIDVRAQEFNVLRKVDKNVSAFVGATWVKPDFNGFSGIHGNSTTGYQVGLIGVAPLDKKTSLYGIVGVGNKINSYEAGLSYAFGKELELNVGYKYAKYKDLDAGSSDKSGNFDYTAKGFQYGLTYKF